MEHSALASCHWAPDTIVHPNDMGLKDLAKIEDVND